MQIIYVANKYATTVEDFKIFSVSTKECINHLETHHEPKGVSCLGDFRFLPRHDSAFHDQYLISHLVPFHGECSISTCSPHCLSLWPTYLLIYFRIIPILNNRMSQRSMLFSAFVNRDMYAYSFEQNGTPEHAKRRKSLIATLLAQLYKLQFSSTT